LTGPVVPAEVRRMPGLFALFQVLADGRPVKARLLLSKRQAFLRGWSFRWIQDELDQTFCTFHSA
jgi:hypothetical protein